MGEEYRAKVFKSGNSLAIRLPKALGFAEDEEVVLVPHEDGTLSFWKASDSLRKLMGLYGAFSPRFMAEGRGDIDQAERDWSSDRPRSAAP